MSKNICYYGGILYLSVIISVVLSLTSGLISGRGQWYSPDLTLRHQTESLMSGKVALSESVGSAVFDRVWDNGKVQQVWGLGVPLWRLPFEAAMRWIVSFPTNGEEEGERTAFPDRIAFAVAFGVVCFVVIHAFLGGGDCGWISSVLREAREKPEQGIALVLLLAFPPFLALLDTKEFTVYIEVQAYSYLVGVGMIAVAIMYLRNLRYSVYLFVVLSASMGAFVRPTAGVFGIGIMLLVLILSYSMGFSWRRLGIGIAVYFSGGALLFLTNWMRFGAGLEFGHNLNLNHIDTVRFAGRFSNPYELEPFLSALRELFGFLFFEDGYRSDTFRRRGGVFVPYNVTYLVPLLLVAIWFGIQCWKMVRRRKLSFGLPEVLAFWYLVSTVLLGFFYMRFPVMNTRYLLDFGPGFAVGMLAFVYLIRDWGVQRFGERFRWVVLGGVLLWWGYQVAFETEFGRGTPGRGVIAREELMLRLERPPPVYLEMPEFYEIGMPIRKYVNQFNGLGWNSDSGRTRSSIPLFVENPEFLELTVAPAGGAKVALEDYDIIRAKLGLEFLEMENRMPVDEGMVLRFSGPKGKRYQSGIQVVFIAFMTAGELHDGFSRFRLLKVRWKEEGKYE